VSKKHNLVILNEAQHSEESLQKAKYFNFTTSQLTTSRFSNIPQSHQKRHHFTISPGTL